MTLLLRSALAASAALALACATTSTNSNGDSSSGSMTITSVEDATPTDAAPASTAFGKQNGAAKVEVKQADADEEQICVEESSVGSHIPKKVCRSRRKAELQRDQARDVFETHQPTSTTFGK